MDFKQIEAFISVARFRSFSKAANTIFLSQPTISSHIASLERELNVQLFDRTSKEVYLTPAGGSFLEYAINIINTRNNAISNLSNFNTTISGKLNLSASTTPCNSLVPDLIKKFSKVYPDVRFNITEQSSGDIIKDILDLNCEIAIVGTTIKNAKIKSYKLMEDNLVLISSTALNIPDEILLEDLLKYKFILREKNSATRSTLDIALESKGINSSLLNVFCEVNTLDNLLQFVKLGTGVSIISEKISFDYIDSSKIKISRIKDLLLKRNLYLIINSKRTLTPIANAFFSMCKDMFSLKECEEQEI
ncbi:selenium metabolism-associated LysR family transcriptional regulator [Clostridium sp.]|uniref:selenium metabolism-associated LysR family transcriptional regulator n=1 Tax=Clostridium sp. TaxID=1506 RepID=UPI001A60C3F5|nr:selenium metabolism-associated LysR family transcriptional regulator [Clostridium sp.]MBK5235649.1 LysR family transcriptional regulator [Clostridium sp.]